MVEEDTTIPLPRWAVGLAKGSLVMGAQLPTRDGRRMGNAHIVDIDETLHGDMYTILTDAGNYLALCRAEVEELFYPPKYTAEVGEVIARFGMSDK